MTKYGYRSIVTTALWSVMVFSDLSASAEFPDVIYKVSDEADSQQLSLDSEITSLDPQSIKDPEERAVLLFTRGLKLFEQDPKAAAHSFEAAKKAIPESSPLYALITIYHGRSSLTPQNARVILSKLKGISKRASNTQYWRPEQFNLLIEIMIALKNDGLLAKTWTEMEQRVKPAQRSDALAKKVAAYIESRRIGPKSDLVSVVESLAAAYPHAETARWAFQKLQALTCDRRNPYIFSLPLISRLAGNTNLDEGLKYYLIALTEGPVRSGSGQVKRFDMNERLDFLVQIRFWQEARRLAEDELDAVRNSESQQGRVRLAKVLNSLGQIQVKQGDHEAAARTWSLFLASFSGQVDSRPAMENLADSLARLRLHSVSAKMYESLAQSPSSDPILKWHHFWNTYLAGNLKEALVLLERPGYVPQRDRGIDGGLDYWKAKILEKTGNVSQAEELYKKILANNGDNFYSLMVQARKPRLLDSTKKDIGSIATVSFDSLAESNGFLPADEVPVNEAPKMGVPEGEMQTVIALRKWGQYQIARRLFRLLPTGRSVQSSSADSFKVAMDLRDFSYGLKVTSISESPLRTIPSSAAHLEDHMAKHSNDWKLLYPFAYRDIVETMGSAAAIDPFMVLGVMRAESVYDADARSIVGARGLMQIMPFTAVRIARLMNDQRFDLTSLHRPEINIGYGAYYLRKLVDYYKGNSLLAVAAYNGGPVSVDRWVQAYGSLEADEFVETIPFRETRRYVKSVFKNFNQYKFVWQQSKALVALPKVPEQVSGTEIF